MSDQFVDDLQALLDEPGHAPKHKMCAVGLVLESVTDEQREKLEILLQDGCPSLRGRWLTRCVGGVSRWVTTLCNDIAAVTVVRGVCAPRYEPDHDDGRARWSAGVDRD